MKTEPSFPTDLTPEERAAGFRLVETRLPLIDYDTFGAHSTTVVAVLPLAPSFRLIKMREAKLHASDLGFGYQLQAFGVDAPPLLQYHGPPHWQTMWNSLPCTIELAIQQFKSHNLDPHWKIETPPAERTVENPERT
jgi:hypothetical protein